MAGEKLKADETVGGTPRRLAASIQAKNVSDGAAPKKDGPKKKSGSREDSSSAGKSMKVTIGGVSAADVLGK